MASQTDSVPVLGTEHEHPAVDVRGLSAGYHAHRALRDVTLSIPRGRLAGVLGPNGSGKSTLLKSVMGLVKPDNGSVRILGLSPAEARHHIGYVPQVQEVEWEYPVTVREVVAMGLYRRTLGLSRFRRKDAGAIEAALRKLDITDLAGRQVSELSGGQRRRALIARALVRDPDLLVLDEPEAGLDATAEEELINLLVGLANGRRTVLVATHDIAGVAEKYDLAICLNETVVAAGPAAEVLTDEVLHETFGRQLLALHGHDMHDVAHHHHGDDA